MPGPAAIPMFVAQAALQEGSNLISFNRNKKFWQERYDQASYPNQVNLMKKAGLNPALMYKGGGGAPSIGGAPEHKQADYQTQNLAETSAQVQKYETEMGLLRKQTITEGFKGKLSALEGEAKRNFVETSKQLYNAEMQLAEQRTIGAEIDNYVKDESKRDLIKQEAQKLQNLKATYDLTGSQKDLAIARAALTKFEHEFMNATGLKPGGIEGMLGRLFMEIMGMTEGDDPKKKQTLEDKIKEAKDSGQHLKASQLRNAANWKKGQRNSLRNFGQRTGTIGNLK